MNKDFENNSSIGSPTQHGRCASGVWTDLLQKFITVIGLLGKVVAMLITTFSVSLLLILLGVGLLHFANETGPFAQDLLAIAGTGILISGGLLMWIGTVLAWWRIFQVIPPIRARDY